MAFLYNQTTRKILLSIILLWGLFSFYYLNQDNWTIVTPMILLSVLGLIFIFREMSAIFLLLLLSFTTSYAFYVFLFLFSLPSWLIMIGILVIFGYLFTYTEQKIGILGNKRLIYLVLFSMIILEVFLSLGYFLINPISQSLIITAISYFFVGFCYTVLAKHTDNRFITYILITFAIIVLTLLISRWGGLG